MTPAEVQRAYRARLAAAGKVVKLVDAGFDPAVMSELIAELRDKLHNALLKLELREQDVARLERPTLCPLLRMTEHASDPKRTPGPTVRFRFIVTRPH